ncbi:MAG TPA: ABC transporter permease [Egicoccus sp.]|nr:ABC transporter permease [Egicoccus sp.]HSK22930.1 ABC transporter permease [Egicoccus sp.]
MSQVAGTKQPKPLERRPVDPSGRRQHAAKRTRWTEFRHNHLGSILVPVVVVVAWQIYVWVGQPNPRVFPGPIAVVRELFAMQELGLLMPAFLESMKGYVVGTGLAIAVGMVLSIAIGLSKLAQVVTMPYLWAFFSMPRVALVPLLILWFGLGFDLVIATVFLSAVVPLIIQVVEGMRTIDGSLLRMSHMFCAGRVDILRKVVFPGTVPYVANGMRQCLSRGFIGLIVVEMLVGSEGLGRQAMRASQQFNTARVMAMIGVLVAISVLLVVVSKIIEASVSRWRETVAV